MDSKKPNPDFCVVRLLVFAAIAASIGGLLGLALSAIGVVSAK